MKAAVFAACPDGSRERRIVFPDFSVALTAAFGRRAYG